MWSLQINHQINNFYFYQFILGNIVGYFFIAFVLTPLYYKLQLVSIYTFLKVRFGNNTYKTGSLFFLVSQSFGAALRLMLAAKILQYAVLQYFCRNQLIAGPRILQNHRFCRNVDPFSNSGRASRA